MAQFNTVLQTRDTARGLIVNMSDVLFDTGKYTLRAGAREKLARVAGILAGHPGLQMQVEGYTDSVGSEDYNQQLSEHRATAVRDYLTSAGIPAGFGDGERLGKEPAGSHQRYGQRAPAESARGIGGLGRHHRRPDAAHGHRGWTVR